MAMAYVPSDHFGRIHLWSYSISDLVFNFSIPGYFPCCMKPSPDRRAVADRDHRLLSPFDSPEAYAPGESSYNGKRPDQPSALIRSATVNGAFHGLCG